MADARLSVLLSAQDSASAVLRGVGNELGTLDKKAAGGMQGFEKIGEGLAGIAKTAAGFALGGLALNLGGDLAEQFKETLTSALDLGRGVRRLQLDVGGSAEEISGLLAVFQRFGVEGEGAERTLSLFSRGLRGDLSATEASTQNAKSFAGTLQELGVESADATGHVRPMGEVLLEVADGFKAHAADGQNAARAQALFGRSGRDLVPVLVLGRDGIIELEDEAKKLGLTLSQDNVDSVRQFVAAQKDMNESVEGLRLSLGTGLIPMFAAVAKAGAQMAKALNESIRSIGGSDVGSKVGDFKDAHGAEIANAARFALAGALPGPFQLLAPVIRPSGQDIRTAAAVADGHEFAVLQNQATAQLLDQEAAGGRILAASAAQNSAEAQAATLAKQKAEIDKEIAAGERESAIIQHDIALKTRESLDMKRTEAELQLEMLPLKAQQADIEQQLTLMTDKRTALMRDAAVLQAQMSANASADALEGVDFEERRLKAKIKADAIGGRGVAQGDIAALTGLALSKPQLELNALLGGRGATLAERDRQRAQQAQDLATIPLKMRAADVERDMASLSAQSAAVQRQIEEARLNGTIDTTDLQKQKQALDDALFTKNQQKADLEGKSINLQITQNISANGEIDYDKITANTYQAVLDGLGTAQRTAGPPAPSGLPGSRGGGTGPF